eukprot:7817129-Karenia_brevis.AAC.1
METSAGQAFVICRKSDEQRDLENTKAARGIATFHDPFINPNLGGMNEAVSYTHLRAHETLSDL